MTDWELFDQELMDSMTALPPPEDAVQTVNPWREAIDRIVLGLCLTCFTLNFLYLQYLLPAVGVMQLYLGFRALRKNNRWFHISFVISICKVIFLFIDLILNATPYSGFLATPRGILSTCLTFALFPVFRQALRQAAGDVGQSMTRDPLLWATVWYGVLVALALFWPQPGWLVFVAVAYVFYRIIKALLRVSEELSDWGYTVRAAPVRVTPKWLFLVYGASLLAAILACSLAFAHTSPKAEPVEQTFTAEETAIQAHLLDLGMPQDFLDNLPPEELEQLSDASACQYLPNDTRDTRMGSAPFTASGTMVYLGGGKARFYVLAEYDDGADLFWQNLAEFVNFHTVRWNGACYLQYERNGRKYRTVVPVEENTETVDNYFTGPSEETRIRARYSFPSGARNRTCLFVCDLELWEGQVQNPGGVYYYCDCIVNFYRRGLAMKYPYQPFTGHDGLRQNLVQYCQIFEFFLPSP